MGQTPGAHRVRQDCTCAACEDTKALARDVARLTRERDEARAQAEGWHRCIETICTILGLSPALGADEACRAVQDYQQQAQITAERDRDEARAQVDRARKLVEKWRAEVIEYPAVLSWSANVAQSAVTLCADELDAILSGGQ